MQRSRFQFTLGQSLLFVTWLTISFALFFSAASIGLKPTILWLIPAAFMAAGAALGQPFGYSARGAIAGMIVGIPVAYLWGATLLFGWGS